MNLRALTLSLLPCMLDVSIAQCPQQLVHLSGTEVLSGTAVTVTSDGYVGEFNAYCMSTLPYYIGFDPLTNSCGDGAYSFHFDPPASAVNLSVSAISYVDVNWFEEVRLFLNGSHYDIPSITTPNACDNLAVLTVNNDIGAPADGYGCTLTIPGPVADLRVFNYMPGECAAGSLFSLYFCPGQAIVTPVILADTVGCAPFTFSPVVSVPVPGTTYAWEFGEVGEADTSSGPTAEHTYLLPGSYEVTLTATDSLLNVTTITTHVVVLARPVVDLGPDSTYCGTLPVITLDASNAGADYEWSTGALDPSITINAPGVYSVVVSNNECQAVDTIVIGYVPGPELGPDLVLCEGDSVELQGGSGAGWLWNTGSSEPSLTVSAPGIYWLERTEENCHIRDTIVVDVQALPIVGSVPDPDPCIGTAVTVNVETPGGTYLWADGSTEPVRVFREDTWSWAMVTVNGCSAKDSVIIHFEDCVLELVMPNVFSPNGDGANQVFTPVAIRGVAEAGLRIWNRWGQEVFATTDARPSWDGRIAGNPAPEGIYYWVLNYTSRKNASRGELHGTVTLVR